MSDRYIWESKESHAKRDREKLLEDSKTLVKTQEKLLEQTRRAAQGAEDARQYTEYKNRRDFEPKEPLSRKLSFFGKILASPVYVPYKGYKHTLLAYNGKHVLAILSWVAVFLLQIVAIMTVVGLQSRVDGLQGLLIFLGLPALLGLFIMFKNSRRYTGKEGLRALGFVTFTPMFIIAVVGLITSIVQILL